MKDAYKIVSEWTGKEIRIPEFGYCLKVYSYEKNPCYEA